MADRDLLTSSGPVERIKILPDGRVSRRDAATFLGLRPKTLAEWQSRGIGPRSIMVGGRRFYLMPDLREFAQSQHVEPIEPIERQSSVFKGPDRRVIYNENMRYVLTGLQMAHNAARKAKATFKTPNEDMAMIGNAIQLAIEMVKTETGKERV